MESRFLCYLPSIRKPSPAPTPIAKINYLIDNIGLDKPYKGLCEVLTQNED